jgi:hypothetical protein
MTLRQAQGPELTQRWLAPLVLGVLAGSGLLAAAWFGASLGGSMRAWPVEATPTSNAVLILLVPTRAVAAVDGAPCSRPVPSPTLTLDRRELRDRFPTRRTTLRPARARPTP